MPTYEQFNEFMTKGPFKLGIEKIKTGWADWLSALATDYISALPIMLGVSVAVYALFGMISTRLAKLGTIGVFVYGALVVII